jgi:hypothetical protein
MRDSLKAKLKKAFEQDSDIFCAKADIETTLGSNPDYLKDVFQITKNELIRLERLGLAFKARYSTRNNTKRKLRILDKDGILVSKHLITGPHRTRWIIFKEVLDGLI